LNYDPQDCLQAVYRTRIGPKAHPDHEIYFNTAPDADPNPNITFLKWIQKCKNIFENKLYHLASWLLEGCSWYLCIGANYFKGTVQRDGSGQNLAHLIVVIKERGGKVFRKISPSPICESPFR
jgi:hypothetical protein